MRLINAQTSVGNSYIYLGPRLGVHIDTKDGADWIYFIDRERTAETDEIHYVKSIRLDRTN